MASSLSNLDNNLSEEIHKIKYKYGHHDKKHETCGITYKHTIQVFLNTQTLNIQQNKMFML